MKKIIRQLKLLPTLYQKKKPKRRKLSLREQYRTQKKYRAALVERIIERAENHVKKGDLEKSINSYLGFLQFYSVEQEINNRLGSYFYVFKTKKEPENIFILKKNFLIWKKNV